MLLLINLISLHGFLPYPNSQSCLFYMRPHLFLQKHYRLNRLKVVAHQKLRDNRQTEQYSWSWGWRTTTWSVFTVYTDMSTLSFHSVCAWTAVCHRRFTLGGCADRLANVHAWVQVSLMWVCVSFGYECWVQTQMRSTQNRLMSRPLLMRDPTWKFMPLLMNGFVQRHRQWVKVWKSPSATDRQLSEASD